MALSLDLLLWVNLLAGLVALALGGVILALRRTPAALALAAFAISAGAFYVLGSLVGGLGLPPGMTLPAPLAWGSVFAWGAATLALFVLFPPGVRRGDAPLLAASFAITLLVSTVSGVTLPDGVFDFGGATARDRTILRIALIVLNASYIASVFYPLRARDLPGTEAGTVRSYAIMSVGFALLSAGTIDRSSFTFLLGTPSHIPYQVANVAFVLLPILLWVRASRGAHARIARDTALAMCAIGLAAMLLPADVAPFAYPVGRVLAFLFLGYAVLRGQLEGLDVKVRFALSKSTVAAAFIAVFFLASEIAQQFFSATFASAYVGIAAAGMLVFAIAPLQRAAERLAERAVPVAPAPSPTPVPGKEQAYRAALRVALRDRVLSREEEIGLAHLSDELGLSHKRAREIWHEIEAEHKGGAR